MSLTREAPDAVTWQSDVGWPTRATHFRPLALFSSDAMTANLLYDSEVPSLVITHRKVRRSRCMCLLFLFLIATFVGFAPIMVYRSLGVPLPEGLKGYRNMYAPFLLIGALRLHRPLTAFHLNPQPTLGDRLKAQSGQGITSTCEWSRSPSAVIRPTAGHRNGRETQIYQYTQGPFTSTQTYSTFYRDSLIRSPKFYRPTYNTLTLTIPA